ncbi:MAG: SufD family Fe-S cluster assembly protein [Paracoccaceae bacterium]|nr:SufD family Fe-S cluster assembly protein [Paracoccaceae bacterium]
MNNLDNSRKRSKWALNYQKQCQADLKKVGMPSRNAEYWKFTSPNLWETTDLISVGEKNFLENDPQYIENRPEYYVEFVDGIIDPVTLQNLKKKLKECEISDFEESVCDQFHWANKLLGKAETKARKSYERPFALLNGGKSSQGIFLNCKESPRKPIHIFYSGEIEDKVNIRHLLKINCDTELHIIEHFSGNAKYNVVTEGFLDPNSTLNHNRLVSRFLKNSIITHLFVNCMESSVVKTIGITLNNGAVRNETFLNLEGSQCDVTLAGLGLGCSQSSICDNTVFVAHLENSCKSRQIIKNVLTQGAKAVFQGKIYVDPKAQKTDGYQMSNGLILDEKSNFLVKPELEIYADDVICSHGSTSGSLNTEHLFYLKSRGISTNEARKILVEAFLEEVIEEISDLEFAKFVRKEIQDTLI